MSGNDCIGYRASDPLEYLVEVRPLDAETLGSARFAAARFLDALFEQGLLEGDDLLGKGVHEALPLIQVRMVLSARPASMTGRGLYVRGRPPVMDRSSPRLGLPAVRCSFCNFPSEVRR